MQNQEKRASLSSLQVIAFVLLALLLLILKFGFRPAEKTELREKPGINFWKTVTQPTRQIKNKPIQMPHLVEVPQRFSLENGGFEEGIKFPWGTGLYSDYGVWWNSMNCQSVAEIDSWNSRSGRYSLHIVNLSPRHPHVFGNMSQRISIEPKRRYLISLWAKAKDLASASAVNTPVDPGWFIRPIQLPAGTFDWTQFQGEFSLDANYADIRILIEDTGEVWIDDIEVKPFD